MERMMLVLERGRSMDRVRPSSHPRGFTLVELLVVVVMVAVLATVAVFGVRKYILAAKSSEAYTMVASIQAAEEAYKDETFVYLDVTGSDLEPLYPQTDGQPSSVKWHWQNPDHALYGDWQALGVDSTTAVQFGYAVAAGGPGQTPPDPGTTERAFNWPTTNEPWYVVVAVADRDEDGVQARVVASSFSSEVYVERDEE
jgi:type IV pilus assembly protein PilA